MQLRNEKLPYLQVCTWYGSEAESRTGENGEDPMKLKKRQA